MGEGGVVALLEGRRPCNLQVVGLSPASTPLRNGLGRSVLSKTKVRHWCETCRFLITMFLRF